jgi:hypothetical protein
LISKKSIFLLLAFFALAMSTLYASQNDLNRLPDSSRGSQRSCRWAVSADFLFWLASEEVNSIWADVIKETDNVTNINVPGFDFKWDYGFRVGLGSNLVYDQWDTVLYYTWFHTKAKHSISSILQLIPAQEFFAGFLSGDNPTSMSAQWGLSFNMFDWELGRNCWVSKSLSLRPFLGIKGGWINQSIHAQYYDFIIHEVLTNHSGKEHLKNNFWGIGPLGGINLRWNVHNWRSHFFNLFGDFSTAGMWGTWICSDTYKNTLSYASSVNTKKSSLGALMFRGFMGIGWDVDFNDGRSNFSAKLGYEMQLWLNQLRINTFQLQRLEDDLTLQGITFNCRCDF